MWKKYFKKTFEYDGISYIFDSDNQMVIMFEDGCPEDMRKTIENVLNGLTEYHKPALAEEVSISGCDVEFNGIPVFCARGWGYLSGSLRKSNEEACAIQDSLLKFVIKKLKEQPEPERESNREI